jgi:hypothetical protein
VDGIENAKWLLGQLSRCFVFKTSKPFGMVEGSSVCSFEVQYNPSLSRAKLESMLAPIPEVQLMAGPEVDAAAD